MSNFECLFNFTKNESSLSKDTKNNKIKDLKDVVFSNYHLEFGMKDNNKLFQGLEACRTMSLLETKTVELIKKKVLGKVADGRDGNFFIFSNPNLQQFLSYINITNQPRDNQKRLLSYYLLYNPNTSNFEYIIDKVRDENIRNEVADELQITDSKDADAFGLSLLNFMILANDGLYDKYIKAAKNIEYLHYNDVVETRFFTALVATKRNDNIINTIMNSDSLMCTRDACIACIIHDKSDDLAKLLSIRKSENDIDLLKKCLKKSYYSNSINCFNMLMDKYKLDIDFNIYDWSKDPNFTFQACIDKYNKPLLHSANPNYTLLHYAAFYNAHKIFAYLKAFKKAEDNPNFPVAFFVAMNPNATKQMVDVVLKTHTFGWKLNNNPMQNYCAASKNNYMLEKTMAMNAEWKSYDNPEPLIITCARFNNTDAIKFFADYPKIYPDYQTALHIVLKNSTGDFALAVKATLHISVDSKDRNGITPLMLACQYASTKVVAKFLDIAFDTFIKDDFGHDIIHYLRLSGAKESWETGASKFTAIARAQRPEHFEFITKPEPPISQYGKWYDDSITQLV